MIFILYYYILSLILTPYTYLLTLFCMSSYGFYLLQFVNKIHLKEKMRIFGKQQQHIKIFKQFIQLLVLVDIVQGFYEGICNIEPSIRIYKISSKDTQTEQHAMKDSDVQTSTVKAMQIIEDDNDTVVSGITLNSNYIDKTQKYITNTDTSNDIFFIKKKSKFVKEMENLMSQTEAPNDEEMKTKIKIKKKSNTHDISNETSSKIKINRIKN